MKALDEMDASTKLRAVTAYEVLREQMHDFLTPFARNNRVVTQDVCVKYDAILCVGYSNVLYGKDEGPHEMNIM
jgi:hypothetical protein